MGEYPLLIIMANKEAVLDNLKRWYLEKDTAALKVSFKDRYLNAPSFNEVQIEVTKRCNLNCAMCPHIQFSAKERKKDMSFEEFTHIIDNLPSTIKTIILNGIGESSLNKDFLKMLQYLSNKDMITIHYTNGLVFDPSMAKYLNTLVFSIDRMVDNHEITHLGHCHSDKNLIKIKKLMTEIAALKEKTHLWGNITLMDKNGENIPQLLEFCGQYPFEQVHIQPMTNNFLFGTPEWRRMEEDIGNCRQINWEAISKCYVMGDYPFDLHVWYPRKEMKGLCNFGFTKLNIDVDGNVTMCCRQFINPIIWGNLHRQSLAEILKIPALNTFRLAHQYDQPYPLCDRCHNGVCHENT